MIVTNRQELFGPTPCQGNVEGVATFLAESCNGAIWGKPVNVLNPSLSLLEPASKHFQEIHQLRGELTPVGKNSSDCFEFSWDPSQSSLQVNESLENIIYLVLLIDSISDNRGGGGGRRCSFWSRDDPSLEVVDFDPMLSHKEPMGSSDVVYRKSRSVNQTDVDKKGRSVTRLRSEEAIRSSQCHLIRRRGGGENFL
jgi:hypothetical protein